MLLQIQVFNIYTQEIIEIFNWFFCLYIKGNNSNSEPNDVASSDTDEQKKANQKFDDRKKLNLISGGSYKRIYDDFQPTVGILKVHHFVNSKAYGRTVYDGICLDDQPCVVMRLKDHHKLCTTVEPGNQKTQAEFMKQGNFYMALRFGIFDFFKSGILNVYADDIIQMLEYLLNTDIPNFSGLLITTKEFDKLVKMIKKKRDKKPESTSLDYVDLNDE